MPQAIVNLALPIITHKVAEVLESYPLLPEQKTLAATTLREQLVTYVLRRMPAFYTITESTLTYAIDMPINCLSKEQQERIDDLIYEGIHHLIERATPWETAAQAAVGGSPSHWFG